MRKQLMYRGTYFAGIVGQWLGYGATFATLLIMVNSFDTLNGWNGGEIMVLYGISTLSYAIGASFFFTPATGLSGKIRSGEFDAALTKPVHPFVHEMFTGINVGYVSHITLSLAIIVISLISLNYSASALSILYLVLMITGASLVQAAFLIGSSVFSFFTINENPVMDFLLHDVKQFTNYPITIFPKGIQFIITFILPFAFINFYPSAVLLGKAIPEGYPWFLPYLTPAVGAALVALSVLLWNWGLKHYQSTGS